MTRSAVRLGDAASPLVAEHEGDGGLGDAGGLRDVAARWGGVLDLVPRCGLLLRGAVRRGWRRWPSSRDPRAAHMVRMTQDVIRKTSGGRVTGGEKGRHGRGISGDPQGRHAARLLAGTLVGRLPNATGRYRDRAVHPRREGGTYSLAGALAAVYGLANAVGQPLLGRAVDLYGQPRVQLPRRCALGPRHGAVRRARGPTRCPSPSPRWPSRGSSPRRWKAACGPCGRASGPRGPGAPAYAMDAVAQEVMFTVGPAAGDPARRALVPAGRAAGHQRHRGAGRALGGRVASPRARGVRRPREAHWLGALRSPGLLALLGAFLFVGLALGSITVRRCPYADDHGGDAVYGWLMAALGLGALVGGLAYGARQWAGAPERGWRAGSARCWRSAICR